MVVKTPAERKTTQPGEKDRFRDAPKNAFRSGPVAHHPARCVADNRAPGVFPGADKKKAPGEQVTIPGKTGSPL